MASKRKTAKGRLRQAMELARGPQLRDLLIKPKTDFSDERAREICANFVLTVSDDASDKPLRLAFEAFRLDPKDPLHWRILLKNLAGIIFAPPRANPRGAPPKWDERRRLLFRTHVAMARKRLKLVASRGG